MPDAPDQGGELLHRLAEQLRRFGASPEAIQQAIATGDAQRAIFDTMARRAAADRTVTAAEIERAGGMHPERLAELMLGFGLPVPADDERAFSPEEARALTELWRRRDVWPFELAVQLSRLYGRLLARIARATVELWISVVEPAVLEHPDERTRMLTGADVFEQLLPVADVVLMGVHRRWLEREAAQMAFRNVPLTPEAHSDFAAVEVSLLFCDLKDFTAFADRRGDDAAVRIIDRFAAVVLAERGSDAGLTKLLGDGFMLAYPTPRLAVEAGARIIAAMSAPDQPGVHASVHHGLAVPREGDYFGKSVNLTARLLGEAGRDELVATREVVDRCDGLAWTRTGTLQIRGISEPIDVFKLASPPVP
jgi:adenylate cyclase